MCLETIAENKNRLTVFFVVFIWGVFVMLPRLLVAPEVGANMFAAILSFLIMKNTGLHENPEIERGV